jgi:endonuclease G
MAQIGRCIKVTDFMFRWIGLFLLLPMTALAAPAPDACSSQFYQGQMPDVAPAAILDQPDRNHVLCFSQFGVEESGLTKTPLWSAEHLTADRVNAAKQLRRKNTFHAEPQIPEDDRAVLSDYKGAHYDRGHMSPDDDMPDTTSMHESFSLSNMVPQDPCNNEIIWKAIETSVRNYVLEHHDVYVVTGPIFDDQKTIGNGVRVPTRLFKAVYDPTTNQMIIIVTVNASTVAFDTIDQDQLTQMSNVTPFPTVTHPGTLTLPPLGHITGACKKDSPKTG